MSNDDYRATGINDYANLEVLLKTRREMIETLIGIVDRATGNRVTAYGALKTCRIHFDKAVLTEIQSIVEAHKAVGLLKKQSTDT